MTIATSNSVSLYHSKETEWGETPNDPTMTQLLFTGESLTYTKGTQVSETIVSDEMRREVAHVSNQASGDINFEMAFGIHDFLIESAMANEFATVTATESTIAASNTGTLTDSGGDAFEDFEVGDFVGVSGFTYQAGGQTIHEVTAKTDSVLTIYPAPSNEAEGQAVTVTTSRLKHGTTQVPLLIERRFTSINSFHQFLGMVVGQMSLSVQTRERATGTFSLMGKGVTASGSTVSDEDVTVDLPELMTGSAHVSNIRIDGAAAAFPIQGLEFSINRNLRDPGKIGSFDAAAINRGFMDVTGTASVYFGTDSLSLYAKKLAHSTFSLSYAMTDNAGNSYGFIFPRAHYLDGDPNASGGDQDLVLPVGFQAIRHPTLGFQMKICKVAAL